MKEELIIWTSWKLRSSTLQKTMSREWEDKPQTGRKYLQKNTPNQGFLRKIYKEHLKFDNKKKTWLKKRVKILTDISQKKIYRWQISLWKDASHHMSPGKCKLKQWETATCLLEWPESRTLTTPKPGKDVEQEELSFMAGGGAKWCNHLGRQFGAFLQD